MKCGRPWCCPGKEHVVSRPNIRIVSYVNCGLARLGQPSLRPPRLHRRRRRRPHEGSMSRHNARPHAPPFAWMLGSVVDLTLTFFHLAGIEGYVLPSTQRKKLLIMWLGSLECYATATTLWIEWRVFFVEFKKNIDVLVCPFWVKPLYCS